MLLAQILLPYGFPLDCSKITETHYDWIQQEKNKIPKCRIWKEERKITSDFSFSTSISKTLKWNFGSKKQFPPLLWMFSIHILVFLIYVQIVLVWSIFPILSPGSDWKPAAFIFYFFKGSVSLKTQQVIRGIFVIS